MTPQNTTPNRGWTVTGAAVGINLVLGSLYAWGVVAKALVEQWHWSKTQAAMPFTVSTAVFAVMMIFAGRAQDKLGPRRVALLGGIMFGLGLLTSGFVESPLLMLLTYGLLGGVGLGLCYSATTPPAIKWFPPARKGLITGIVVAGVGLAAVYVSPLTQWLLVKTSIAQTFIILGIGATIAIVLMSLFLVNPPPGYQAAPAAGGAAAKSFAVARRDMDWHEMLRTVQFYQLWAMFVLAASAGLMLIAHIAIIAKEQADWKGGFVLVAVLAIFNTLGRIASGYVSDRIGRTRTLILAFVVQAINLFAFVIYRDWTTLAFGTALAGLCYGAIYTLMPAATADLYGIRNLGVNYGLVFSAFGVAGVLGPILAGLIRDHSENYTKSYIISGVLLLVAAVLAMTLRSPKATAPQETPVLENTASR